MAVYDIAHLDRAPRWSTTVSHTGDDPGSGWPCSAHTLCLQHGYGDGPITTVDMTTGRHATAPGADLQIRLTMPTGTLLAADSDTGDSPFPPQPILNAHGALTGRTSYGTVVPVTSTIAISIPRSLADRRLRTLYAVDPGNGRRTRLGTIPIQDGLHAPACAATATRIGCIAADGIHIYRLALGKRSE